jgi:hypothetical protein
MIYGFNEIQIMMDDFFKQSAMNGAYSVPEMRAAPSHDTEAVITGMLRKNYYTCAASVVEKR